MGVRLLGYFPAKKLGLGEDLPGGVAREWARWCRNPNYISDERGVPLRPYFDDFSGPLLAYSFSDDRFAPRAAVEALLGFYHRARKEHRHLSPADLKVDAIDHFGWLRESFRSPLWEEMASWLRQQASEARPETGGCSPERHIPPLSPLSCHEPGTKHFHPDPEPSCLRWQPPACRGRQVPHGGREGQRPRGRRSASTMTASSRGVLSQGNLGMGEAYVDGDFSVEEGELHELLTLLLRNRIDRKVRGDPRTALKVLRVQLATSCRAPSGAMCSAIMISATSCSSPSSTRR